MMKPLLLSSLVVFFLASSVNVALPENIQRPEASEVSSPSSMIVIGNKDSKRYHLPGMPFYNKVKKHHRVYFKSEKQAIDSGYYKAGTSKDSPGFAPINPEPPEVLEKRAVAAAPVLTPVIPPTVVSDRQELKQPENVQKQEKMPEGLPGVSSKTSLESPKPTGEKPQERTLNLTWQEGQGQALPLLNLTLQDCLDIAFQQSRLRAVSRESIKIAEAQHGQAQSGHWPQMKLSMTAVRMDEPPMFLFPSVFPSVPPINVKLMDRDLLTGSLGVIYPLYTGGKISALNKQAKIGVEVSKEEARQTDLQIARDVKQYFYGHILARTLHRLGRETLERFEATESLTESVYQHGSGKVKKTDYLRSKVITSNIRSIIELLKSNEELSRSALANAMGVPWKTPIVVADVEIPFTPYGGNLDLLVAGAHQHNPQMNQVRLGLAAYEAKITEAKSGHLPIVALFGNINRMENSYDGGLSNDENRNSWQIGMALELPIFNGFRTTKEIQEARGRLEKLRQQSLLLEEGVALQVKHAFLQIARSQGQVKTMKEALDAAVENRQLNIRAYAQEMVETKDVIEAQLMELLMQGQYLNALYDHQVNASNLEYIVGSSIYEKK